jgi:plasmid stabilization system protein ParE
MNSYSRSNKSTQDIWEITRRSLNDFGEAQTLKYMAELKERLQLLADRSDIGRVFTPTPPSINTCSLGMKVMLSIIESLRMAFL